MGINSVQVNALVYVGDSKSREVIRTYEFNATRRQGTMRQYKFEVVQLACWTAVYSGSAGQSSVARGSLRQLQARKCTFVAPCLPMRIYSPRAALVQVVITTYELILKDAAILNQVCAVAHPHPPLTPLPWPFPGLQAGVTCWIASQEHVLAGSAHYRLAWHAAQARGAPVSARLQTSADHYMHVSLQPFAINLWHAVHPHQVLLHSICQWSALFITSGRQYLLQVNWNYMMVDEAHRLKNSESALYQELMRFRFRNKLLITGGLAACRSGQAALTLQWARLP